MSSRLSDRMLELQKNELIEDVVAVSENRTLTSRRMRGRVCHNKKRSRTHVTMVYQTRNPYAVTADIDLGRNRVARWLFDRDVLQRGAHAPTGLPAGLHRVRVWSKGGTVLLGLAAPRETTVIQLDQADVTAFLSETFALVPAGAEPTFCDIDGELAQLLAAGS